MAEVWERKIYKKKQKTKDVLKVKQYLIELS